MDNSKPWWVATKTARQGFVLGGVYALVGTGELVSVLAFGAMRWVLGAAGLFLLLSAAYLTSSVAMSRRGFSGVRGGGPARPVRPDRS